MSDVIETVVDQVHMTSGTLDPVQEAAGRVNHSPSGAEVLADNLELPIFDLVRKSAAEVQEVIQKAIGIAGNLNHQQLKVCHVLLALTLTIDGVDRLQLRGLDKRVMQQSSWQELQTLEHAPPSENKLTFSENVRDIFRAAYIETKKRPVENQNLQIDDLLAAILQSPLGPRFAHYFSYGGIVDPIKETLRLTFDLRRLLENTVVPGLERKFDDLAQRQSQTETKISTTKHIANVLLGLVVTQSVFMIGLLGYYALR